jgi:protein involved in polysaccharide export with SLBB domain
VTIDGAVPFPREIDIGAGLTLKESIVKCGGLLPVASRRNIHLVRGSEVIKLNLKFERDADFVLLPGDKVHVPAKLF